MKKILLVFLVIVFFACKKDNDEGINGNNDSTGTVTDYDGNTYNTIKIGTQWWMAENLKTTHYANGIEIQLVESISSWDDLGYEDKAYCYYYNNENSEANTYGALYTWAAAMNEVESSSTDPSGVQGVCPTGWHLPSDDEWKELEMHLGMSQADAYDDADEAQYRGTNEGSKLAGNSGLWNDGNLENEVAFGTSGFQALPGGVRDDIGGFSLLGNRTFFWSATEYVSSVAYDRELDYHDSRVGRRYHYKYAGFSVRCLKD